MSNQCMVCKEKMNFEEELVRYDGFGEEVVTTQDDIDACRIEVCQIPHVICVSCDEERTEKEFFLLNEDGTPSHDLKLLTYYKE